MKGWLLLGLMMNIGILDASAQADMQLSQHMFNRMNYNPAVTGASRYVNVAGFIREQWRGWKGAPRSQMLTVHNYFDKVNSGFGLVIFHDVIGLEESINIKLNYAYHVKLSEDSYLSLGLGAGILHRYFNRSDILSDDIIDENLPLDIKDNTYPDFDFGVEFNMYRLTAGASVTHLAHPSDHTSPLIAGRHYYAFVRYVFPVDFQWDIEPSLFVQQNKSFIHSEVNVLAYYKRRLWFGMSLRGDRSMNFESLVPMVGIDVTKFLRLGYSYDVNFGDLHKYTEGTHEVVIGLRIRKDPYRYSKSPRFFE